MDEIQYRRHRPAYMTGFEQATDEGTVATVDELLELSWVQRWRAGNGPTDQFKAFCWSPSLGSGSDLLMVQLQDTHWVIGYLAGETREWRAALPQWRSGEGN